MFRWIRRSTMGLNVWYCACGHHRCYHSEIMACHVGICPCARFIPETTIQSLSGLRRAVEAGTVIPHDV